MLQEKKESSVAKKAKKAGYQLEPEIALLIEKDSLNRKLWAECKESLEDTKHVTFILNALFFCYIHGRFYVAEIRV